MSQVTLYLDEDVNPRLARDLSQRGYDAVSTNDEGNVSLLATAISSISRVARVGLCSLITVMISWLLPKNIKRIAHNGIVYVPQVSYGQLLQRVLHFLARSTEDAIRDTFIWIP